MNRIKQSVFNLFFLLLIFSCQKKSPDSKIAFYYNKSFFSLSKNDKIVMEENKTKHLYVHYYDVELKSNQPTPTNVLVGNSFPKNKTIIPIISIKNEVFEKLNQLNIDTLVNRIAIFTQQINKSRQQKILEIIFDCNWSIKTQNQYFYFLKVYNKLTQQKVSTIIYGNQAFNHQKFGIPPVDKVIFVDFNQKENQVTNQLKNYPLSMSIAIEISPNFVQMRNGKEINKIKKINFNYLINNNLVEQKTINKYIVTKNFTQNKDSFLTNDEIIIHKKSEQEILNKAEFIAQKTHKVEDIVLYHLDSMAYSNFSKDFFQKVEDRFN